MQDGELYSRIIADKDYPIISKWCLDWKFPDLTLQPRILPKRGFIISDKEENDIICCFVYLTDSCFAHPEWVISNKSYNNKKNRFLAFRNLFKEVETYAKQNDKELLLMSVKDKSLLKSLTSINFITTDISMTNLIKRI